MHLHDLKLSHVALGATAVLVLTMQGAGGDPQFERGKKLFDTPFSIAQGLGAPEINGDSCRACHQEPVIGGAGSLDVNVTRFARDNGGAGPFQNLAGGQILSKLRVPSEAGREEYEAFGLNAADCFEQRNSPSLLGDGLIEQIPDAVIAANEDVNDANGDGIFGVARRITVNNVNEIGRFGWKAQIPRIDDFVHDAMFAEMGITTPEGGRGFSTVGDGDAVADPELPQGSLDDITHFIRQLPAPERGGSTDPRVAAGEATFAAIGCAKCHVPSLSSPAGDVPLYSNLLLHNVMEAGFRGMEEPGASVGFYRTPPLWGIKDTAPYMHDGRAEDLRAAILAHRGEAEGVRQAYQALVEADKEALILFLEDL